jgi:tellurite resistance protein
MPSTISHHAALIYVMVVVSAVDRNMNDHELRRIGSIIRNLPIFADFSEEHLISTAQDCAQILDNDEGLETVLGLVLGSLPETLYETAYALAAEVAAADLSVKAEELRILQILRNRFVLDRLVAAAIERTVTARHQTL